MKKFWIIALIGGISLGLWSNISFSATTADEYYRQGCDYFDQKKDKEAAEAFEKAVELKPDNAIYHYNLGITYCNLEKYEEALKHFEKVVELAPESQTGKLAKETLNDPFFVELKEKELREKEKAEKIAEKIRLRKLKESKEMERVEKETKEKELLENLRKVADKKKEEQKKSDEFNLSFLPEEIIYLSEEGTKEYFHWLKEKIMDSLTEFAEIKKPEEAIGKDVVIQSKGRLAHALGETGGYCLNDYDMFCQSPTAVQSMDSIISRRINFSVFHYGSKRAIRFLPEQKQLILELLGEKTMESISVGEKVWDCEKLKTAEKILRERVLKDAIKLRSTEKIRLELEKQKKEADKENFEEIKKAISEIEKGLTKIDWDTWETLMGKKLKIHYRRINSYIRRDLQDRIVFSTAYIVPEKVKIRLKMFPEVVTTDKIIKLDTKPYKEGYFEKWGDFTKMSISGLVFSDYENESVVDTYTKPRTTSSKNRSRWLGWRCWSKEDWIVGEEKVRLRAIDEPSFYGEIVDGGVFRKNVDTGWPFNEDILVQSMFVITKVEEVK